MCAKHYGLLSLVYSISLLAKEAGKLKKKTNQKNFIFPDSLAARVLV